MAAACLPLVPDRVCYNEWFDSDFCYRSLLDDADQEAAGLAERVIALATAKQAGALPNPPVIEALGWQALKPAYQRLLSEVVAQAGSLYDSRLQ